GRIDLPLHREIDVDDVLVAGEHQAFLRHVPIGPAGAVSAAEAHLDAIEIGDADLGYAADRIRPVPVQAVALVADIAAEDEFERDLVGTDHVGPGGEPGDDRQQNGDQDAAAAERAARHEIAHPVLALAQ